MLENWRILIIKHGLTELLLPSPSTQCSLGEIFRSTILLNFFRNDHVFWLTHPIATPLLTKNRFIETIIPYDSDYAQILMSASFDLIINLEKDNMSCTLAERIHAPKKLGFTSSGRYRMMGNGKQPVESSAEDVTRHAPTVSMEDILIDTIGRKANGESYILGYQPQSEEIHDVGFNDHVGEKLPTKVWPEQHWNELAGLITAKGFSVSRQQHLHDLYKYMDWINSCRTIISCDSLGLFLAIAMGKKVIGLFGPTSPSGIRNHPQFTALTPSIERNCQPCYDSYCIHEYPCMHYLAVSKVLTALGGSAW